MSPRVLRFILKSLFLTYRVSSWELVECREGMWFSSGGWEEEEEEDKKHSLKSDLALDNV